MNGNLNATEVWDLVDQENRTVSNRVLSDDAIYRTELEQIFARAWIVVGHESEVPNEGDYVQRYVGEDPVIVVRQTDGTINVLLNVCPHRGAMVCRAERGNSRTFKCPYHGWVFGGDGRLRGVVAEREMYGEHFDKSKYGLAPARSETYAGLVFATFDDTAPSLDDYLGDYRFYLDMVFARSKNGMEVIGPPQRWVMRANWKSAAEQFSTDGYHALTLHRSINELGMFGGPDADVRTLGLFGLDICMPQGHALRCMDQSEIFGATGSGQSSKYAGPMPAGMTTEMLGELEHQLNQEQLRCLGSYTPTVGNLFPNLGWLNIGIPAAGDSEASAISTIRSWIPLGPEEMEVASWVLVERDAPPELKARIRKSTIFTFSDSGIFEQDDAEAWSSIARGTRGVVGRRQSLSYSAKQPANRPNDYPTEGVGAVYGGMSRDDNQWQFWMRWAEMMAGKAW